MYYVNPGVDGPPTWYVGSPPSGSIPFAHLMRRMLSHLDAALGSMFRG